MIKTTYTLDPETIRSLGEIAARYKIPKSEAVRRAVAAFASSMPDERHDRLAALERLQAQLRLDDEAASRWANEVVAERSAMSRLVGGGEG